MGRYYWEEKWSVLRDRLPESTVVAAAAAAAVVAVAAVAVSAVVAAGWER